jgi:hypothetical protein
MIKDHFLKSGRIPLIVIIAGDGPQQAFRPLGDSIGIPPEGVRVRKGYRKVIPFRGILLGPLEDDLGYPSSPSPIGFSQPGNCPQLY